MAIKRNLHIVDIIFRVTIGLACIYMGFIDAEFIANKVVSILVGIFGVLNLMAATTRYCPIYTIVGFTTYREPE
jgi:hypothetical protein